jgi:PAS domain S-box-containing protein
MCTSSSRSRADEHKVRHHLMSEVNALRRQIASLEKALQASSDPTVIVRLRDGLIVQVNESMADLTGYSRAELIGQTTLQSDLYTDPADHRRLIAQAQKQGQVYGLEAQLRRKSGEVRQVVMSATPVEMNGELCAVIVISDITAFKWLERALRQSEQRYRMLFDGASDAIYIHDLDGRILEVNQHGCERLGYSHAEMLHMTVAELASADQSPLMSQRMAAVCERGDIVFETTQRRRDGTLVPVEVHARRIEFDGTQAVLSVTRDITERRQAEAQLITERNLLRTLIDSMPDMIYIKDTQSRYLTISRPMAQFLGAEAPEGVLGKTDFEFCPHEMAVRFYEDEQRVMRSGQPMIGYEEPVLKVSSGERRWFSTTQVPLRDATGQIMGLVGISRDITELKRTEESLKQSQRQLEMALQGADLGWYDWNVQTNEVVINDRYAEMVGYSVEEMQPVFKTWETLIHPDDRAHEAEEIRRELTPPFPLVETESRIRCKDGEWRWILDRSKVVVWDAEGKPLRAAGTHLDITPRKRAEQEKERLQAELLEMQKRRRQTEQGT